MGLCFAARYPMIFQAAVVFVSESLIRRNWRLTLAAIAGAAPTMLAVVWAVYMKTGTFQVALAKDVDVGFVFSPFYIVNSVEIWGWAVLLVPVAFLFKRTYSDSYNLTFIAWFVASLLFWSSNTSNLQYRFAVGFTPAVNYLIVLAIERLRQFKSKRDLVFTLAYSKILKKIGLIMLHVISGCSSWRGCLRLLSSKVEERLSPSPPTSLLFRLVRQ